jgi:plastocyanin
MKRSIISGSRFLTGIVTLAAILIISGSCSKMSNMYGNGNTGGTKGGPGTNEVWIQGSAFTPAIITITAGTTITCTNKDPMAHTVTSNTAVFNSGTIGSNGSWSNTFTVPGSYPYFCSFHPYMKATVVVN